MRAGEGGGAYVLDTLPHRCIAASPSNANYFKKAHALATPSLLARLLHPYRIHVAFRPKTDRVPTKDAELSQQSPLLAAAPMADL